jgi:DivIVA domain-containing protein
VSQQVDNATGGWSPRRQVPLSPDAIRHKPFRDRGRHGYDRDQVDLFLDQVATDVEQWIAEVERLREDNWRLKEYIRNQRAGDGSGNGNGATGRSVTHEAVSVLSRAQQQADLLVATAHDQARAIVGDADAQAKALVNAAYADADRAARDYRASAGGSYSAEGENLQRRLAWLRTIMQTLTALRAQLPAIQGQVDGVAQAFAFELEQLEQPTADRLVTAADVPDYPPVWGDR